MAVHAAFKYPIVCIEWIDAATDHGWEEISDSDFSPTIAVSVGFMIKEDDTTIVLASSYTGTASNNRLQIPKGMIKTMKVLKK